MKYCTRCETWKEEAEFNIRDQERGLLQSDNQCTDCGEADIEGLTFDHVRGEKKYNISNMVSRGYKTETIRTELEKTEIVCFNCHMRRERRKQK